MSICREQCSSRQDNASLLEIAKLKFGEGVISLTVVDASQHAKGSLLVAKGSRAAPAAAARRQSNASPHAKGSVVDASCCRFAGGSRQTR